MKSSRNHHVAEAVRRYLAEESRQVAKIRKGLAEADANLGYDQEDVESEMTRIVAEARSRSVDGRPAAEANG